MHLIENDVLKVLITKEEIETRCKELAAEINRDYADKNPMLICLLKGALPFLAKLLDYIKIPMEYECIRVSSYQGMSSTGNVVIENFDFKKVENRHIIFVEDIIDSGLTLYETKKLFATKNIASCEIMALLNKPILNKIDLDAKYIGFVIPNEFVIGFGLDYDEQYRNLPYIGVMKPEAIKK